MSLDDEYCPEFDAESVRFGGSSKRDVGVLSKEHGEIGQLKKGSNVEKEFAHMYQAQQVSLLCYHKVGVFRGGNLNFRYSCTVLPEIFTEQNFRG